jgi:hypothetical protein
MHQRVPARAAAVLLAAIALWALSGIAARAADVSPCALLEPAEVEAVIGPLAGPPFRASGGLPDPEGGSCRYEAADLRAVELRVEWSDGGQAFGIMNMTQGVISEGGLEGVVTLSDGTELTGEWDEARVFMCCEFNALRGEQLVTVDISGSRATVEQAASLADAALRRLEQPLTVDDAAGIAAAEARDAERPARRPACELVPRAEAEVIIGTTLSADPSGDENECIYTFAADGFDQELALQVVWRGGFSEMRMTQAAMGQAFAFLESQGLELDEAQAEQDGTFDEESVNMLGVTAVRKDVMFSIETGGYANEVARALIAKAASKL